MGGRLATKASPLPRSAPRSPLPIAPAPADISSNNLLIQEQANGGCHLLLADPSMCMRACDLANPDMWVLAPRPACLPASQAPAAQSAVRPW